MECNKIKINIKLCAYTKGIIPDVSKFIEDAPKNGNLYGRQDGEWIDIKEATFNQEVIVEKGSGLDLKTIEPYRDSISIRQRILNELPEEFEDDMTYYIIENTPNTYVTGGTSFSFEEQDELYEDINGGNASSSYEIELLPINSKGVSNE